MKIFLNPGHMPGVDPGATNANLGLHECNVALMISEKVKKHLEAAYYEVTMVQSDNLSGESPKYQNVTKTANEWKADLFISLHCNACTEHTARGTETLVYSKGGDAAMLATCINDQIVNTMRAIDHNFPDRGVKERTDLAVLRRTSMPAVLVEMAFIDNDLDAKLMIERSDDLARAIARGISDYYA